MIIGLELGVHCPTLFLVCERNKLSRQIHTEHLWFFLTLVLSCPLNFIYMQRKPYVSRYDKSFDPREMILLLCRGLLVKDGDAASRVDNSGGGTYTRDA